jgi:serine phosphatase RsbU (regulator of sigma subunit)
MPGRPDAQPRPYTPAEIIFDALAAAEETAAVDDLGAPVPAPRFMPAEGFNLGIAELAEEKFGIDELQRELDSLKEEINNLRRRDETLNFYMTRLDEELRLAAKLQQDFLPKQLPQVGSVYFHTLFRPAGYVSGDLYDVMRLDERRLGFFLVDAVGHGMPAALLTMFIKRALVTKEIDDKEYRLLEPSESMQRLNDAIVEQNLSQATFCTAIYGVLDVKTLELKIATGGHPTPLLLREGKLVDVEVEGPLLGIFADEKFSQSTVQLQSGDRLLVYTDGIEVAFQQDLVTHTNEWKRQVADLASLPAEGMLINFANKVDGEVGSLSPKDDLTVIVVEVK